MGKKSPRTMCLFGIAIATLIGHLASAGQFEFIRKSDNPSVRSGIEKLIDHVTEPTITVSADPVKKAHLLTASVNSVPDTSFRHASGIDRALFTRIPEGNEVASAHKQLLNFRTILRPTGFQLPDWQNPALVSDYMEFSSPSKPFLVMIDPGHGGTDPGAIGHNGLLEKDLTLDIAKRVRLFLTEVAEIDVQLTRSHDHGLSRKARVNTIRRANADLVISLHFNHLPQTQVNLVESYYAAPRQIASSMAMQHGYGKLQTVNNSPDHEHQFHFAQDSALAAQTLQQHVYSEVSFEQATVQNAGVKEQSFFVLTQSLMPGVLMEISCLSHEAEADRLTSDDYRNRLAASLVDGIRSYHEKLEPARLAKALAETKASPGV